MACIIVKKNFFSQPYNQTSVYYIMRFQCQLEASGPVGSAKSIAICDNLSTLSNHTFKNLYIKQYRH